MTKRKQHHNQPNAGRKNDTYSVTGYKAFRNTAVNPKVAKDFTCHDHHYKVGSEYQYDSKEHDNQDIEIGKRGFHFCTEPGFIQQYYDYMADPTILFAEIKATGRVLTDWDPCTSTFDPHNIKGDKYVTDRIKIVREIPRDAFLTMCTGEFRAGDGTVLRYLKGHLESFVDGTTRPAVERGDGSKEWRYRGKLHNPNGPSKISSDGTVSYYSNGQRHRTGGPAVRMSNGQEEWWQDGALHRLGGPAMTLVSGAAYTYIRGKQVGCC